MSRYHYPPQVLVSTISSFKRKKASTRREQNGYLRAKVMKIIGKSYHFRLFFLRNIKILLCEGTQTATKSPLSILL